MQYQSADLGGLHHLLGAEIIDPVVFLGPERPYSSSRPLRPNRLEAGEFFLRLMGKDFVTREIYVCTSCASPAKLISYRQAATATLRPALVGFVCGLVVPGRSFRGRRPHSPNPLTPVLWSGCDLVRRCVWALRFPRESSSNW